MSRTVVIATVLGSAILGHAALGGAPRRDVDSYPPGYTATGPNGYVYVAPGAQAIPPAYPYGYGSLYYGSGYLPPPIGFGSPSYNGYNDPNYPLYGPGVRDFLRFGGADFYGW